MNLASVIETSAVRQQRSTEWVKCSGSVTTSAAPGIDGVFADANSDHAGEAAEEPWGGAAVMCFTWAAGEGSDGAAKVMH